MPTILIADACKPSLVMSSEVFKDKIPGACILVANSGKQCLEVLQTEKPDMCVVDFDLPDADGVALINAMRKTYRGPILLTAYPDANVESAVLTDLFAFNDAGAWIQKPVKFDALSEKIDQFLLDKHRLGKRFNVEGMEMETLVIGKGAGRGKRAPKVSGRIVNLSLGGVCVEIDEHMAMKGGEEMTVALDLPPVQLKPKRKTKTTAAKKKTKKAKSAAEAKIKCKVCWVDKKNLQVGFAFNRLTEVQKKGLESLLRSSGD